MGVSRTTICLPVATSPPRVLGLVLVFPLALAAGVAGVLSAAPEGASFAFGWMGGWYGVIAAAVLQRLVWRRFERRLPPARPVRAAVLQVACAVLTLVGWLTTWRVAKAIEGDAALSVLVAGGLAAAPLAALAVYGALALAMHRHSAAGTGGG